MRSDAFSRVVTNTERSRDRSSSYYLRQRPAQVYPDSHRRREAVTCPSSVNYPVGRKGTKGCPITPRPHLAPSAPLCYDREPSLLRDCPKKAAHIFRFEFGNDNDVDCRRNG